MSSKKPVPIAVLPEGMPYVGGSVGNVGALSLTAYVHVVEADAGGHLNSRVTSIQDIVNLVTIPASGISQATADGRYLQKTNNLSDVASPLTARANLSVYSIAQVDTLFTNYYTKAQVDAAVGSAGTPFPHEAAVTKPLAANGTWNQALNPTYTTTVATAVDKTYGLYVRCPALPAAANALKFLRFLAKVNAGVTGNAAAVWSITVRVQANSMLGGNYNACLIVRNPANDKMIFLGNANNDHTIGGFYGNSSGGVAVSIGSPTTDPSCFPWRRFRCDNTTITCEVSADGNDWETFFSGPLSQYIGGGDLEFGIGMLQDNNNANAFWCHSLVIT